MILRVVIIVAALIAIILLFAATKPKVFHVQRSITVNVPPETVFPLIDDLHNWPRWAPQDKEDPTMKRTYSGAANGKGAVCDWAGAGNTGSGRMSITESLPPTRISIEVNWVKPFVARNVNEFTLQGTGNSTTVTWSMEGPNLYVMRLMSVFMSLDRTMGKHFETGLANLKAVAEADAPKTPQ